LKKILKEGIMKKYLLAVLALIIITTVNSDVKAGFPPECENTINEVMKTTEGFEGKNLQQVLEEKTWSNLKEATRRNGSWEEIIVPACCKPCSDTGCKDCPCDGIDPCTWGCRCCWGDVLCSRSD
jgi:hypothetical protein